MRKTLIVIAGPTAVGKTKFAIAIAQNFNTHIISADSRQFYREMNIGTAKPTLLEQATVPHHFVDTLSVTERYTVGNYEKDALSLLDKLFTSHNQVVLVGGSGLYINAVIQGFDELPVAPPVIRDQLNLLLEEKGIIYLQNMLREVDPEYYSQVDLNNPQRIIRALEVFISSGKSISALQRHAPVTRPFDIKVFGLNLDRTELYHRIERRVDQMIEGGLVQEAERLLPYRNLNPLNTVGYTELFEYFDGKHSLARAIELIKQNTRRFAKRQITWFKKTEGLQWITPDETDRVIKAI